MRQNIYQKEDAPSARFLLSGHFNQSLYHPIELDVGQAA
jgi:hypothetical protein